MRQVAGVTLVVNACEAYPSVQAWRQGQAATQVDPDTGEHRFHVVTIALMLTRSVGMLPVGR